MKLAIDLDDVVLDTTKAIIDVLKDKHNIYIDANDIDVYDIGESTGLDHELISLVVNEAINSEYIEPIFGAVPTINWLGNYLKPIYFLTNRYDYKSTLEQIQYLEFDIEYEIHLCKKTNNGVPNKAKLINDLGINTVIEDRVETIMDIYKRTNADIVVFDKPWNKYVEENDRIFRVKSWIIDIVYYFMNHGLKNGGINGLARSSNRNR